MTRTRRAGRALVAAVILLLVPAALPGTASAQANTVDLRLLVVTDAGPSVEALRTLFARVGIPVDVLDLNDPGRRRIDAALLADGGHAHYQGVVLPDHAPPGLSAAELAALYAYERRFGIRQLDASATAKPTTGLAEPTPAVGYSGAFDGGTAQLTPEALAGDFAYARGPVPFSDDDPAVEDSYVQMATPLPGFRPLLTATSPDGTRSGALAGILTDAGREEFVLTFSFDADARQLQVLAPGLVSWLTRGVHLGFDRSYLAVHIDDVLLPNVRWVPGVHCTPGADCPPSVTPPPDIRMTADDVAYAVEWQRRTGFRLDLAFNGAGSVAADAGAGTDPLTAALVAAKGEFGWINHTWSHRYLGCVRDHDLTPWSCATLPILGWTRYISSGIIESEITRNVEFARRNGLPIDPTELVTGEHGGLRAPPQLPDDNPHLAGALADAGIRTIAADGSIEPGLRPVGDDAVAVPRHPIDLDFDTATVTETIDQYNWVHTSRADGGNGECEADGGCQKPAAPGSGYTDHIVPVEAEKVLDHMLTNDPRPHYVHQPQLTEDRTIYPLLDRAIGDYRSWFGDVRPLITPTMTQTGHELGRQQRWAEAVAAGRVQGRLEGGAVTVVVDGAPLDVPLTTGPAGQVPDGAAFGTPYGTGRSAWVPVTGERQLSTTARERT
jgi:hypothetical protein